MNKAVLALSFACALGLAGATLRAAETGGQDTVTLKDGRVLRGDVIEESNDKVVVLVDGVKRTFGRTFIKRIAYGAGQGPDEAMAGPSGAMAGPPDAPGATVPGAAPSGDLASDIAVRYKVPVRDVLWVRAQGIPDADLPLVFLVAATAGVVPRSVVRLRLAGWTWAEIETHYGMNASHIYYEPGPWAAYPYYWYPGAYWGWGWGGYWGGGWGHGWGHGWGGGHWR